MGKIIEMPDPLECHAQKIEAALDRQDDARERGAKAAGDWREATFELAVELAEAKKSLRNNTKAFGAWCAKRFGDNRLPHQDRAALVRWGQDPEGTRAMLVNEMSQSIQGIDARVTRSSNSHRPPSPKRDQVKAFVHAYKAEHGVNPPYALVEEETGVSNNVVIRAFGEVKLEAEPKLTKGQNYDVEAHIKVRMRELEKEFEARVTVRNKEDIDKAFPRLQELQDKAALSEKLYREQLQKIAVFKKNEYLDIIKTCHPDNSASAEVRHRAFVVVMTKQLRATGEE